VPDYFFSEERRSRFKIGVGEFADLQEKVIHGFCRVRRRGVGFQRRLPGCGQRELGAK
jgi:hypothetical protein